MALAGLALLAWAVPRLARWGGANPALASGLALASPLMVANGVAGLHNDLLMVGLMAAGPRRRARARVDGRCRCSVGSLRGEVARRPGVRSDRAADRARRRGCRRPVAARRERCCSGCGRTLVVPGVVWGLGIGWFAALAVPGTVNTPLSLSTWSGAGST